MHIAIIMPAFNVAPFLRDAILSVRHQTHAQWSLTIVDDGSTDATAEIAAAYINDQIGDERIGLIRQQNSGVSAARNRGIAQSASPDAFLFLDGDDWLAPEALAELARTLDDSPSAIAACGRYARVAMNGATRQSASMPEGCLLEPLLTQNLFANGGHLLIRREAVECAGNFRQDLTYGEDWEYWTRLALRGEFAAARSRSPLLFVRERFGSACLSRATDPAANRAALDTIYHNPAIADRLGPARLRHLRSQAEAETAWAVGRELIRHGQFRDGQRWLSRSIGLAPSLKRVVLIGLSWWHAGPFRPYETAG